MRGQLTELRQADLRFSAEEAEAFLKQGTNVVLSKEEVLSLNARAEGWVAGLQMAALSVRDKEDASRLIANFSGGHEYIMDFFAAEVLAQQPKPIRTFLLQTSILNRLCGPLCNALTQRSDGQQTLEEVRQSNLFVVNLDSQRYWYRYHHLFSDLLRKQLQQKTPDLIPELHRRASCWYEQNGLIGESIEHALRADDYERAEGLISQALADSLWKSGESMTILRWLESLPEKMFHSRPYLCAFHALTLFLTGQLGKAESRLKIAEQLLEQEIFPNEHRRAESKGMIAVVRAYIAYFQGDAQAIIKFANKALDLLPEENLMWRNSAAINLGDAYSIIGNLTAAQQAYSEALKSSQAAGKLFLALLAGAKLAVAYKEQGHLHSADEICQQLIQFAEEDKKSTTEMRGKLFAIRGDILCEWNELESAETYLHKAVELCRHEGNVAALGLSYLYLIRVLFARKKDIQETLLQLERFVRASNVPIWIYEGFVAWKSWFWISQGNLAAAEQVLQENGITSDGEPGFRREGEYFALARLLIAKGCPAETEKFMEKLCSRAEMKGQTGLMIVCLSIRSVAHEMQGLREDAISLLEKALSLGEPEGYVQIFIEEGQPMARMLYEIAARNIAPKYVGKLLAAFSMHSPQSSKRATQTDDVIEPLSKRELDVLCLIAEGLTNQQIASRLYLSLRTIKFHTSNIYAKLGVNSRTEALAKARILGLLIS